MNDPHDPSARASRLPLVLCLLCAIAGVVSLIWIPAWGVTLSDGEPLRIWRHEGLRAARLPVVLGLLALPALFLAALHRCGRRIRDVRLAPLAALPLAGAVQWLADGLPIALVSNVRFFVPPALAGLTVAAWWAPASRPARPARARKVAALFLAAAALYAGLCYHAARTIGPSAGDECCYILMARSLHAQRTLDMRGTWAWVNGLDNPAEVGARAHMHLAPNARDGRWYSWHPFGLPLLLAPLWPLGRFSIMGRSLGMGLIAAAGCVGLWLLCRRVGARPRGAWLAMILMCGSAYWTGFASRVLTEMPGAALLIWLFWAVAACRDRPWRSLFVAALTAVYAAFVHLRFLPLGLLGAGFFGLAVLSGPDRPRAKALRLAAFTALLAVGYGVWFAIHHHMYDGPAQPISGTLMSYPAGIWAILVDRHGAGAALFGLHALIGAHLAWCLRDPRRRLLQAGLTATVFACMTLNCSNPWPFVSCWDSTPGRYLFVAVPLLAPGLAVMLSDAPPRAAVAFFAFLAGVHMVTTAMFVVALPWIGEMGHPLLHLTRMPGLVGLPMPFAPFYEAAKPGARAATILFAVAMTAAGYVCLRPGRRAAARGLAVAATAAAIALAVADRAQRLDRAITPSGLTDWLARADRARIGLVRPAGPLHAPERLLRNPLPIVDGPTGTPLTVTTTDLGTVRTNDVISLPRIPEANDWAGRALRWATLTAPFKPTRGRWLLRVEGRVEGGVSAARLAVREGAFTLFDEAISTDAAIWRFEADVRGKRGDLYILGHVEGEGDWRISAIHWLPWRAGWEHD